MDCPTGQKMWAMERTTRETGESVRSTSASCSPEKGASILRARLVLITSASF